MAGQAAAGFAPATWEAAHQLCTGLPTDPTVYGLCTAPALGNEAVGQEAATVLVVTLKRQNETRARLCITVEMVQCPC
jgi:hypothetical protein